MGVYEGYFPMGLGTSRFPILGPNDIEGLNKSIDIVKNALDNGINYIDTAYTYSAGMAQTVLKEAFKQTKKEFAVTCKVLYGMDKTAEDAIKRVKLQLNAMGIEKAKFFTCWTISSYEMFEQIMAKGGIYEGALKLQEEGLIEHITFSSHASDEDTIRIIRSGVFSGVTVSYSMLNATTMKEVLDVAYENNVDVAVMNPLGGGIIAQNQDFFSFAKANEEESTITGALRFAKAHPAVKIILSGVSSVDEFNQNIKVFNGDNTENDKERFERVSCKLNDLKGFCTGCDYCKGCPVGIPISELMKKRNSLLFETTEAYNRTETELVKNIRLFRSHSHINSDEWFPKTAENPCIGCGVCESKCTQKLGIIKDIDDLYNRAEKVAYTEESRKTRLEELVYNKSYKKIGIYPNGGFANLIVEMYEKFFGEPDFDWYQFNSDPKMWGEFSGGMSINSPNDILDIKPDIIIIGTFKYDEEIYADLKKYEKDGIKIVKLHKKDEVPWVF